MSHLLSALLLGILEGLTEFLPISSTGHLLIAEHWLGRHSVFFNIVIQAGAILATCVVFRKRLVDFFYHWNQPEQFNYLLKLAGAFGVTVLVGLPLRLAGWQLPESLTPIAYALIIGGIWILACESYMKHVAARTEISWKVAIGVGLAQVIAGACPGTSRSGAAIFLAMLLGLTKRSAATEFVFLTGIPTMFAASGYAFLETLRHSVQIQEPIIDIGIGFFAALITGFIVVRWLLDYITTASYTGFAYYRICIGALLFILIQSHHI